MRSVVLVVILLAAFIVNSAQQGSTTTTPSPTTTNPSDTTDDASTTVTTTIKDTAGGSAPTTEKPQPATPPITPPTKPPTTPPPTTTPTTKASTTPTPPRNLRPVGQPCLQNYFDCTENSAEFVNGNFCSAFGNNVSCFNGTSTNCSAAEVNSIKIVDCGPNVFGTDNKVGTLCRARITECVSLSVTLGAIKITADFTSFFCSAQNTSCFTTLHNKAVCNETEYTAAKTIAKCTAAHTVISSALFISLAVLTPRLIYRY